MNKVLRPLSVLALAALPVAGLHAAFDPSIVPAEARWVVSLDLNAVRDSALGKELLESLPLPPLSEANGVDLKLDPRKLLTTVGTVTAYGSNFSREPKEIDGVLVLQGNADLRKLAEGYVAQCTVATPDRITQLKDLPCEAYALENGLIVAFPQEPIVILSRSQPQVVKALEVFRTHAGSMARGSSALGALLPASGPSLLVAGTVVPTGDVFQPGEGPHARILQMANTGALVLGNDDKTTTAHLTLVASTEELADKLLKIVQGVAAMVSLAETDDKQLAEFLQSVNITRSEKAVTLRLAYPTDGILRLVRLLRDRKAAPAAAGPEGAEEVAEGKVVARWTADQAIGQPGPTAEALVTRTIEKVSLTNGTLITLAGQHHEGENARIDCVEVVPASGGPGLLFEAENMRLRHYRVEALPFASRGKVIMAPGRTGTAQFEFPGADGLYTLKVRYIDESDGKSTFSVSTRAPEPSAGPN